jgi:hypothetical protein
VEHVDAAATPAATPSAASPVEHVDAAATPAATPSAASPVEHVDAAATPAATPSAASPVEHVDAAATPAAAASPAGNVVEPAVADIAPLADVKEATAAAEPDILKPVHVLDFSKMASPDQDRCKGGMLFSPSLIPFIADEDTASSFNITGTLPAYGPHCSP